MSFVILHEGHTPYVEVESEKELRFEILYYLDECTDESINYLLSLKTNELITILESKYQFVVKELKQ